MSDFMTVDRGVITEVPRRLRLVTEPWPDQSDTDQHYEHHRIPTWAWLLAAGTGGFFGSLLHFAAGGS